MKKIIFILAFIISSNSFAVQCVVLIKGGDWDLYQDKTLMRALVQTASEAGYKAVFHKAYFSGLGGQPIVDHVDFTLDFMGVGSTNGYGDISTYDITKSKFADGEGFISSENASPSLAATAVRQLLTPDCK